MQSCNTKDHQDMKRKEISNKRNVPQTYTTTGYITIGLCKLNASRTTIIRYNSMQKIQNIAARLILGKMPKKAPWSAQKPYTGY